MGKTAIITLLLDNDVDPSEKSNDGSVLHRAVLSDNAEIIQLVLGKIKAEKGINAFQKNINVKDKDGDTPLIWAVQLKKYKPWKPY